MAPVVVVRCIAFIITAITLAQGSPSDTTVETNSSLVDWLCGEGRSGLTNGTTIVLPEAYYTIPSGKLCSIENVANLWIQGNNSMTQVVIECLLNEHGNVSSGFVFVGIDGLKITNVTFEGCGAVLPKEILDLANSSLIHFRQAEIAALVCRGFTNLNLTNVQVAHYHGRAFIGIDIFGHSVLHTVTISTNTAQSRVCYEDDDFTKNSRCEGSGVVWTYSNETDTSKSSVIDIEDSMFVENTGYRTLDDKPFICGDLIGKILYSSDIASVPLKPVGIPTAGALSFILQQQFPVRVRINNTEFHNNSGLCYGAVLAVYLSESAYNSMIFSECNFSKNTQVLTDIKYFSAGYFGATITVLLKFSEGKDDGDNCFSMTNSHFDNLGFHKYAEIILAQFPSVYGTCTATLSNITGHNTKLLYAVSPFTGGNTFRVHLSGIQLTGNRMTDQAQLDVGEGLLTFSYVTEVVMEGCVFSKVYGPVIAAEVTNVILTGHLEFSDTIVSTWTKGSAIYLRGESKLWLKEPLNVIFRNNNALQGGAIYSVSRFAEYCAFQFISANNRMYDNSNISDIAINVTFESNTAHYAGNSIYAFPLKRCSMHLSLTVAVSSPDIAYDAIFHFTPSVPNNGLYEMSSRPLNVCLCGSDPTNTSLDALTCYQPDAIDTYPGKTFNLSVVALDELNQRVHSVIYFNLDSNYGIEDAEFDWRFGYGENVAKASGKNCTTVMFTIFSTKVARHGLLSGYADESIFPLSIPIVLKECPPGFSRNGGDYCGCDYLLHNNHRTDIVCNISSGMVTRPGTSWIGIVSEEYASNDTNHSHPDSVTIGFSSHCPTRYCDQTIQEVNVSYRSSICKFNRMGVLCGQCLPGLSITVGSPLCKKCTNQWLAMIPLYGIIGIVIVALMMLLQLTVAQGTINGLIFYANLLNVNTYTMIAGYHGSEWAIVFVAFLNLELGFPVCLYNGMDELDKALLSIVFPTYIWLLAILFILVSHYSQRFSHLTAQSAIPVLATLLYISYFKLLRFSVDGFAYGIVDLSGNSSKVVWYYDGNVPYLGDSRHILLFVMVVVVVCLFIIPYGIILTGIRFFGRFRIINRFKPLTDAYFAPFKDKCRFWFGARLWVLLILYILFAILRNNPLAFLLCQAIVLTFFTLTQAAVMPYKSKIINVLDLSFMVNALLVTIVVLYTSAKQFYNYGTAVSVAITLVTACIIVGYHAWKPSSLLLKHCRLGSKYAALNETEENAVTTSSLVIAGSSEVTIQPHGPKTMNAGKYRDSILEDTIADTDEDDYSTANKFL